MQGMASTLPQREGKPNGRQTWRGLANDKQANEKGQQAWGPNEQKGNGQISRRKRGVSRGKEERRRGLQKGKRWPALIGPHGRNGNQQVASAPRGNEQKARKERHAGDVAPVACRKGRRRKAVGPCDKQAEANLGEAAGPA